MQNKPNLLDAQMNLSSVLTTDYENKSNWTLGQNKPNSNPIKANFRKAQMNVNSLITKDYRKKDDFAVQKNKPNSKPISQKAKMNANAYSQKDYENETALRPQKNKPNSNPISNAKKEQIYFFKSVDAAPDDALFITLAEPGAISNRPANRLFTMKLPLPFLTSRDVASVSSLRVSRTIQLETIVSWTSSIRIPQLSQLRTVQPEILKC